MMAMRVVAAAVVVVLLWPLAAAAQTLCDDAFNQAQKSYDLGLFDDVPGQLAPCLGLRTSRGRAAQVHALLARAYLEMEELEKARAAISTVLRLDSAFEPGPSPRFAALVAAVRGEEMTVQVASVSKTSESLREAPATVVVITGEEIQRRGYLDLEQLLHDLPGFDISRLNGAFYSIIYQRGYNAAENDRNLLLVDGIEQNDLAFGTAYLSRQYPLSNIDRVEVIYGPASTMYGANAYTGVISIITKTPEALAGEKKPFGLRGQVTGGGYGGGSVDVTAGGRDRSGSVAWSIAANMQRSEERDLSSYEPWDFTFSRFDYKSALQLAGTPAERAVLCATPSPYIRCEATGIHLTDEGEKLVRGLDSAAVEAQNLYFGDNAKNWSVHANLRLANLILGVQSWRSQEGLSSAYTAVGSTNWTPRATAFYLKYSLPVGSTKLNVFSRFIQTSLERSESELNVLHAYSRNFLSLYSLVEPCRSPFDPQPVSCAPASPWLEVVQFGNVSTQFRTELNGVWEPSRSFSGVAGVELSRSSIQGGYDQTSTGLGARVTLPLEQPEQREHSDYAVYAQGSWKPRPSLKIALAGRMSYNQIDNRPDERGYGALFTPRLALVYSPGRKHLVFKAIYSEAFKDPTDFQKFGVEFVFSQAYRSNGLRPEHVRNVELSAGWEPAPHLSVEGSLYQAQYSDVVAYGFVRHPDGSLRTDCFVGCEQWQNRDEIRIRGLQIMGRYRRHATELWANYTHSQPFQTDPDDFFGNPLVDADGRRVTSLRLHGIASHRVNAGIETALWKRLDGGLRAHWVSRREMGAGTTLPRVGFRPAISVDANTTVDAVLSYRDILPNTTLQLSAFNLLDAQYSDPASDPSTQMHVLQAGRTFHLRLTYALPFDK